MKWTTDGFVCCDDCQNLATAFYWQRAGVLGKPSLPSAIQAGLTMHLCAKHDYGVCPEVWCRYCADTKSGSPA